MPKTLKLPKFKRVYREDLLREQGMRCAYCYEPLGLADVTFDHVKARSRGGHDGKDNGAASCRNCNQIKGSRTVPAFKKAVKHPQTWAERMIWLRRRLNLATMRACRNILRAAGIAEPPSGAANTGLHYAP